ncbi:hypothetical protein G3480_00090 [Thiorhodococcus mannitoliphagus]|uniref:Type II secretion system protein GspC N-terminal domain-containing protein n=1 Tax=Thiorhodococcus mannitoliphagus TaxID=329406 RepID=A0A6P1DSQ4_9GAMM|nr:hypothetical protein [Thiorhodococcus mannitoliphagus]NEX18734.1 hypothetical protein [Thiorhodococcus mannitoliphagus]
MIRAILGLVVLTLVAILSLQWLGWSPDAIAPATSPAPTEPAPANSASPAAPELLSKLDAAESRDSYVSVVEHPLFRPDRKPEEPEDEEPEVPVAEEESHELDAIDLSAVLISPTIVSAWVKNPAEPKLQRLRIGDEFLGWSVSDILEDRVLLVRQGEQDKLILRDYSKSPSAAPPARTPARRSPPRPPRPANPPKR